MEVIPEKITLHRSVGWAAVAALLFLRIPFSVYITYSFPSDEQWGPSVYQVGTYFLIAFLIWWERGALSEVHIDTLALLVIMLFKPVQTLILDYFRIDIPLAFPHPVGLSIWLIALALILALWRSGYKPLPIQAHSWGWLVAGLFIGSVLSTLLNLDIFKANAGFTGHDYTTLSSVTTSTGAAFLYQLGFAAISEEPVFRGFLWGYLRRSGLSEIWVWLAQAVLFMSAHLYFKDALPFNFWVVAPAAGLILGLLAWGTRSIAAGMLAHATYNAGVYVILLKLVTPY